MIVDILYEIGWVGTNHAVKLTGLTCIIVFVHLWNLANSASDCTKLRENRLLWISLHVIHSSPLHVYSNAVVM